MFPSVGGYSSTSEDLVSLSLLIKAFAFSFVSPVEMTSVVY
jgi:hypothetical protein